MHVARNIWFWAILGLGLSLPLEPRGQVILSEFLAANVFTLKDEEGKSEDWIEIRNVSEVPVDLRNWSLTDDPDRLAKWQFPSTNLAAGQFLVVFASDKNRRVAGAPLHTNFKLDASGEYLALVKPEGKTIATEFAPIYPPQATDISYGLPTVAQELSLLGRGAVGKWFVPADDRLGTDWTAPEFSDLDWLVVGTGVGFDGRGSSLASLVSGDVAESMAGINASAYLRLPFTVSGVHELRDLKLRVRYNDGFIAYLNGTRIAMRNAAVAAAGGLLADSVADWRATDQQGFNNWYYGFYDQSGDADGLYDPAVDFNHTSSHWTWNGAAWVLGPSNPPWDAIWVNGWHPNGESSGGVHWSIRRWISATSGTITCRIQFAKANNLCGSGSTLRVLLNGVEHFHWTLPFDDSIGIQTSLVLSDVQEGDYLDFALDPLGTDGVSQDACDGSRFVVVIEQSPAEGATWNSSALAPRSPEQSIESEEINLARWQDLLVTGTNVLAIHALNSGVEDPDFLILPELIATRFQPGLTQQRYLSQPTPGAENTPGSLSIGPIIREVRHTPPVPAEQEDLIVQARVTPTLQSVDAVTLVFRVMYGPETALVLRDDGHQGDEVAGDSIYSGRIPGGIGKAGQMVRYGIVASDLSGQETRAPAFPYPTRSPQYFGTVIADPTLTNSLLPILHWFIQNPSAADSDATTRASLFFEGEFYDNIGVDIHGQSTRIFPKKSYDLDLNPGHNLRWASDAPRVGALNLLTTWADKTHQRTILAYDTYRDAGAPGHFAFAVRVQRNGAFFSVANLVENGGADFLERLGMDRRGALYKMYNSAESTASAEKKTRKEEGNADLQALINGMTLSDSTARQAFLFDNLDLPAMVNFLAAQIITASVDCCHKNYYLYRDSEGSGQWQALPWDVDLSFGRVWTCNSPCLQYFDPTLYTNTSITVGNGNRVFTPLFDTPATRQMFLRRLRTLMDQLLQPPGTPSAEDYYRAKILGLRDVIAPDAALDLAKWGTWGNRETIEEATDRMLEEFLPGRRTFLFQRMSVENRGEIPLPQNPDVLVQINGVEPRSDRGNPREEWLSLTNAHNYAVDLADWRLEGGVQFHFKPGTVIPGRSTLFVSPDLKAFRARETSPTGGERRFVVGPYSGDLPARGGSLSLTDASGRLVHSYSFPGVPSSQQQYLRITEIFYNPDPFPGNTSADPQLFEFIELRNTGPVRLDLAGVRFTRGVQFDFTAAAITQLEPGARLLVAGNLEAFALRYGSGWPIAGEFLGNLDNAGERLRLEDRFGEEILDFSYDDQWHPITDGRGASLLLVDEMLPWSAWGLAESWRPNSVPGGFAGDPGVWPGPNELVVQAELGGFRLRYLGTPASRCELQRSFDLIHWNTLVELTIPPHGLIDHLEPQLPEQAVYFRVLRY